MLPTPTLLVRLERQSWGCASSAQQQPKYCSVISSFLAPNAKRKIFISAKTNTEKLNPHFIISQYALTSREWWKSFHACCDGPESLGFCHPPKFLMPGGDNLCLQPESLGCEVERVNPESSSLGCSLQIYFVYLSIFWRGKYGSCLILESIAVSI